MQVFRIASAKYSKALIASGNAARWNRENELVLYAAQHRSLATLELVVHRNSLPTTIKYETMVISIADDPTFITDISIKQLPKNWQSTAAYSDLQSIGSEWYKTQQSLILRVPSVIIPQEHNFIINTRHPDFFSGKIALTKREEFYFDNRLLKD